MLEKKLISQRLSPVFSSNRNILAAVLFGSQATGENTDRSDIDIAVYVKAPGRFSFKDRLALHGDCCRALHRDDVDLVVMNQLENLILLEHIIREGKEIYVQDRGPFDIFTVTKLHQIIDFRQQRKRAMCL